METYNSTTHRFETEPTIKPKEFPMAKIYGFLALALLITGGIAFAFPHIMIALGWESAYAVSIIVSAIAIFPIMIVFQLKAMNPNSIAVPICYFLYSIAMGVMLSSVFLAFDITDIFFAFVIAGGTFGLMAIVGFVTKKSLNGLLPIIIVGMLGALILSLVNIFLRVEMLYWIAEFVMFGAILLITAVDMNNIKRIAASRKVERNLAMYCAFNLYIDFIYIFVRILYFLAIFKNNN